MTRIAISGPFPEDIDTGFAEVQKCQFTDCDPVIPAWFGRHFVEKAWTPIPLFAFLKESGLLKSLPRAGSRAVK